MPNSLENRLRRAAAVALPGSTDFDLNPDVVLPENRVLRPAAVLVGVRAGATEPEVLLTKRSSALKHHPGQIAFPGGKQDEGDVDLVACALREAREEVGLPEAAVNVIGVLPPHETVTNFTMTPILAQIDAPFDARAEPGEVDEIFWVPLSHVSHPDRFSIQSRRWRGRRRYYYTVPFGPYYIWGATARILRGLAERMR